MRRAVLLAILVAATLVAATAALYCHERADRHQRLRQDFDLSLRQTLGRIAERIATFQQLLDGTKGLLRSSPDLDEAAFQHYIESLLAGTNLAGLRMVGFARLTEHGRDSTPISSHISLIAPSSEDNLKLRQVDQLSDPRRKAAILQAIDTGRIAVTGRIGSDIDGDPGLAMFLAVYDKEEPTDATSDRRVKASGWVFTSLKMRDLIGSFYGERIPGIIIRIYDGTEPAPDALLYDSSPGTVPPAGLHFHAEEYLDLNGRYWMVALTATPEFEERFSTDPARAIGLAGLGLSGLAALLAWQLASSRARAYALADEMTKELRESEAKLQQVAWFDPLTRLPNRALFSDRLRSAMALAKRRAGRLALMFVDLDRFKPVNDTYGHDIGDKLLMAVSTRLHGCLRDADTLGRVGGDEFVILLPDVKEIGDAQAVAEKIRAQMVRPFQIGSLELKSSCSIGIAIYPDHGGDELSLMKFADAAMYGAKAAGRENTERGIQTWAETGMAHDESGFAGRPKILI
jgi:diguanylate cyclase (GGDEF)-like protein